MLLDEAARPVPMFRIETLSKGPKLADSNVRIAVEWAEIVLLLSVDSSGQATVVGTHLHLRTTRRTSQGLLLSASS